MMDSSRLKKRRSSEESVESAEAAKWQKNDTKISTRPTRSVTSLEKLRQSRGTFVYRDGAITGPCVLCSKKLSLSWYDWKQHLLEHTDEKRFYCFECNAQFSNKDDHISCPADSIIDVFGAHDIEHEDLCAYYEIHVTRVTLVPDVCPQTHIIPTQFRYVSRRDRYRCGAGYCTFHGNTPAEYAEHFHKAHSVFKTFYCPHCNLLINRKTEPTVAVQNVLRHIEAHASTLHQCFNCEYVTMIEDEMRAHMMGEHDGLPLKFWRNARRFNASPDSELIEIVLDCALCGERVHNIPESFAHFKDAHPSHDIHFKALKLIKATTDDLEVTCSIDDSSLHYREVLVCGLCDEYFTDKLKWLKHFSVTHPRKPYVVRRGFKWLDSYQPAKSDSSGFDRSMLFFCAFCENANGVKLMCSSSVEGIYDHWQKEHKRSDAKPFRFYMAELVGCYYCDVMSTFQGLQEHMAYEHPDEPFVAVKAFETVKQCALCDHSFHRHDQLDDGHDEHDESNEADGHFHIDHALALEANVFNPIRMNDFTLLKLLQIGVHKKVKCDYCAEVFETRDEYRAHHSLKHRDLERLSLAFVDKETIKLVGDCCHQQIDPNSFYDHLEFHTYALKCDLCMFRTSDPFNFMKHKVKTHDDPESLASLYLNFLQLRYWRSELIFGNGLVINKFNTQGTEYDHQSSFEQFAARLVNEKMQEYEAVSKHDVSV
ncbi:uncharacterized protein LOC129570340 isoform X2 [Sitodiplosis mosellana]|uniref:uncharacterized protein LOC129570340 isoform X2 n=1 Tax=Sitodiplosis mosellana TaxID=263140 RepID=UPI0024444161|nr:uncharacterized protein LOC129570340 isoform X2 [Sitodiplosis mosellana]